MLGVLVWPAWGGSATRRRGREGDLAGPRVIEGGSGFWIPRWARNDSFWTIITRYENGSPRKGNHKGCPYDGLAGGCFRGRGGGAGAVGVGLFGFVLAILSLELSALSAVEVLGVGGIRRGGCWRTTLSLCLFQGWRIHHRGRRGHRGVMGRCEIWLIR